MLSNLFKRKYNILFFLNRLLNSAIKQQQEQQQNELQKKKN
jgi:hypothetical protein